MKRALIISGIVVLGLLMLVWSYLLLFGVPDSTRQTFTDLGVFSPTDERPMGSVTPTTTQLAADTRLQQLTTKPVAGFVYLDTQTGDPNATNTASISKKLRYTERGTGHIYEIDLSNGVEKQLSGVTTGQTVTSHFSQNGDGVVFVAESETGNTAYLFDINNDEPTEPLPSGATNFGWSEDGILHYTISADGTTTAYNHEAGITTVAWEVPLTDINVYWREDGDIVINKPAPKLKSGIFRVTKSGLSTLVPPQYSLFGFADNTGDLLVYSYFDTEESRMVTELSNLASSSVIAINMPAMPEKCAVLPDQAGLWCGLSSEHLLFNKNSLNQWYKGRATGGADLWFSDFNSPDEVDLEVTLSKQTGFNLDVTDLTISNNGKFIFFRNKLNDTLWKYEI